MSTAHRDYKCNVCGQSDLYVLSDKTQTPSKCYSCGASGDNLVSDVQSMVANATHGQVRALLTKIFSQEEPRESTGGLRELLSFGLKRKK